jgi:hypothetical protein
MLRKCHQVWFHLVTTQLDPAQTSGLGLEDWVQAVIWFKKWLNQVPHWQLLALERM